MKICGSSRQNREKGKSKESPHQTLDAVLAEATQESQDSTMTDTPTQLQDSSQQSPRTLLISESDTSYTPGLEAARAIDTSLDRPSSVHENWQIEPD